MAANSPPIHPLSLANPPCFSQDFNRICCIGAGRVGILSTIILSIHWPGIIFVVLDRDAAVINDLNGVNIDNVRRFPFVEPEMDELLNLNPGLPNVIFSNNLVAELALSRVIFIAVDIPLASRPRQVRGDLDVRNLEAAIRSILISMNGNVQEKYVAVKSTLPVDYRGDIRSRFYRYRNFHRLNLVSNPEFFSNGNAVDDLFDPPMVVFGRLHRAGVEIFRDLYLPVVEQDEGRIQILPSSSSAELGKLLSSALMAAQLTVINIGSTLCERVGGRFSDVRTCLNSNPRHQSSITHSRPGFGGLGLNKDVAYLAFLCDDAGLKAESQFFKGLIRQRREKMDHLVKTILSKIGSVKRIGWYGFASKVGTDDLRESPSIYICSALLQASNITILIHDPIVIMERIAAKIPHQYQNRVRVVETVDEVWDELPQAVVLMHDDGDYRDMVNNEHVMMIEAMSPPRHIFDCCSLLDEIDPVSLQYIVDRSNVYRLGMPV